MLAYVRKNANSVVVWFIIGAIAVVFIFFGLGRQQGSMDLVTVNGEEADPYEFQDLLREASSRQRRGAPSPDDEQYARVAALHEQINRILTRQFGENLGLRPGPQALREAVAAIEAFQVDGRFNLERYQAALKSRRQGAADFEEELRRNLTSERAASLVQGLARTYRPELAELFHFQEDQVRFDYLFLADEDGRWDPRPAAGELEAYYAQRRENWRRPAEMTVQYVEISPDDYLGKAEFTEAELEDYYAQNQDRFIKPEAVLARRILFAFPSLNPKEAEKKTALDRAEAARARLDQGADFAALARELSDDRNTAKNGGDMGFMTRGSTFPELEEAAFSAPLNEAVGPVATDAGFNLIQVTARRPAAPSPLAEVRAELAGEFKTLLARRAAVDILENLLNRAEVNPDLADAAQGLGLRAALSRPFTSDDAPGFFENNSEAVQRAFSAPLDRVAPPFEGERILVLYVPRTRQESHIPPFEEMREEADRAWKREAADSLTRQRLESFLPEIRARGWEAYLAAKPSKSPVRSGAGVMTSRYALSVSPPFEKSDPRAVTALAFSAATPGQILPVSLAGQLNGRSGRFLLRLAEYQAADESRLDGSEGRTLEYLLDLNKSHLLLRTWQMGLYEASKDRIEIPPRFLQ